MRDSTNTYGAVLLQSLTSTTLGSAGNRIAQKFTFPSTWGQSVGVAGMSYDQMTFPA